MRSRTTRPSNAIDLDRALEGRLDRRDAPVRVALAHACVLRRPAGPPGQPHAALRHGRQEPLPECERRAPTATDGSATAINESDTGGPARSCSTFFGSVFPNCRPIAATCSDPTTATATPPGPSVFKASWHLCARISDRSAPIVSRAARNAAAAAVADGRPIIILRGPALYNRVDGASSRVEIVGVDRRQRQPARPRARRRHCSPKRTRTPSKPDNRPGGACC